MGAVGEIIFCRHILIVLYDKYHCITKQNYPLGVIVCCDQLATFFASMSWMPCLPSSIGFTNWLHISVTSVEILVLQHQLKRYVTCSF